MKASIFMKKIIFISPIIICLIITPLIESTSFDFNSANYKITANIDDNIDEDE